MTVATVIHLPSDSVCTPPIDYVGLRKTLFVLKQFPEYETLERLVNEWIEEQRALYEELTAARVSLSGVALPDRVETPTHGFENRGRDFIGAQRPGHPDIPLSTVENHTKTKIVCS